MQSVSLRKPGDCWLTPINPFLKIGLGIGLMGLALVLKQTAAMVALVAGLLLLLTQLRLRLVVVAYGLFSLGVFVLASAWLLGDWSGAIFSGLRLLAILLSVPVLALTTPPATLIRTLQTVHLPSFLTLSLMLLWRFFPLMQQELARIWEANLLRGVDLRRHPGQWFSGLMVPLVFQMVVYADEVTIGLQTRGYDPAASRSCSQPVRWRRADSLFAAIALLWSGVIVYLEWFSTRVG
jgi:energy-coupling factor transport system permease protein